MYASCYFPEEFSQIRQCLHKHYEVMRGSHISVVQDARIKVILCGISLYGTGYSPPFHDTIVLSENKIREELCHCTKGRLYIFENVRGNENRKNTITHDFLNKLLLYGHKSGNHIVYAQGDPISTRLRKA